MDEERLTAESTADVCRGNMLRRRPRGLSWGISKKALDTDRKL